MCAMFSGRDRDDVPHVGELELDEIEVFMRFVEAFEWRRVAVASSQGLTILAALKDGKTWINPVVA